jgi:hypothetical protein
MLPKKTYIERDCIMSSRSKREYLEAIYLRYKSASRKKKAIILDELISSKTCHPAAQEVYPFYKAKTKEKGKAFFL